MNADKHRFFDENLIPKIIMGAFLFIIAQGCSSHANYPVTRVVDWIHAEHVKWEVLELSAEFAHQKFNLYNRSSHIVIKAKLKIYGHITSTYKIHRLHISQRYVEENIENTESFPLKIPGGVTRAHRLYREEYVEKYKTDKIDISVIDIKPLFKLDQRYVKADPSVVEVLIEEPISNSRDGRNFYRVVLGDKHIDLATNQ